MTSSSEKQGLLDKNGGYGATTSDACTNNYDNQIDPSLYSNDDDNGTMHIRNIKGGLKGSLANSISHSIGKLKESMRPFPASVRDMGGTSSLSNEMFNLVKNLIGAGAFGIPSGVATLAGGTATKWAIVPAAGIIILLAAIFGYYFVLLGRICKMTMAASYREAWDRSAGTRGGILKKISFLVPLSIIFIAGIGNVAYSMILADTVKSLAERFGHHISRTASLMTLTVFVLLPLCMVKKLSVLAPFSAVGTAGMVFTLVVMAIRCFDGSYDPEQNGRYLDTAPDLRPYFSDDEHMPPLGTNIFLLSCMCFLAYFCHYNAPRYYTELKNNTIPRFTTVINVSFTVTALVYFAIGIFGYYTFGANTDGYILNNYSANDDLASICRFAIAISVTFTYPLPFIGTRDGILDLFSVSDELQSSTNLNILTLAMLSAFTLLAWHFTDLELMNAVGGAAFGTAVVFIFPSIMFYCAVQNIGSEVTFRLKLESILVLVLMCAGIAMGVIGILVMTVGLGE